MRKLREGLVGAAGWSRGRLIGGVAAATQSVVKVGGTFALSRAIMELQVKFYGNYRQLIGRPETSVEVEPGFTLLDVLRALGAKHGVELRTALLAEVAGRVCLRAGVRIAVGEEVLDSADDLGAAPVNVADSRTSAIGVFIFPALGGGAACGSE